MKYRLYAKRTLIDKLAKNSATRLADNYYFNDIKKINLKIDQIVNTPKAELPMTLDAVFKQKNWLIRFGKKSTLSMTKTIP
ncbi:hypothetical protein ACQ9BO_12205 [Flavobacterium sp. P21]|uniref:hypothetical protein n=1 Tax=Flavobacterium sp. P21 TaxID=3423948 RepID=UPI003D66579D